MNTIPQTSAGRPPRSEIVVIGGGIAGLSAALHLAERGLAPLLLEADPQRCGGRLAGGEPVELDGWNFPDEHGVHAIWSPYLNFQAMLARHNIRPVFVPAQEESWIYKRNGRVRRADVGSAIRYSAVPAPFHYLALFLRPRFLAMLRPRDWLSLLAVWYGLLMAVSIDPFGEDQPMEGMWLSDLVQGWAPALRSFIIGLARNGLAGQPEEIPLAGFIAFLRYYTLLRRDSWAFSYLPNDGGSTVVEPLVRTLEELGGSIRRGVRVAGLRQREDGWTLLLEERPPIEAGQVILATDAASAAALLGDGPAAGRSLYWPRSLPTAIVRFWFDRAPRPGPEAGILSGDTVADNFFWLHRIYDPYMRWHRAVGGSAVEMHIYGPPQLLREPDAALLARSLADVQQAFPELRGQRRRQMIRRNDPAHTLPALGPADRHLGVETPWPGLYCCGDWVRHPAPAFFLERACLSGIAAANAVLQRRGRPPWLLLDYPPPEPLVGAIERLMLRGRAGLRRFKER